MNLDQFAPQSPTEFALLNKAKELQRENFRLKMEDGMRPDVALPHPEINVEKTVIEKAVYHPIAIAQIKAIPRGQEVRITGHCAGHTKWFHTGYFIQEDELRHKSMVAERMHELNQRCMKAIADIYD
tara:strand:+ start:63 stop:443 length:381 start_codon:yes stop_codon:yes gene_type:complete